jgi:hypothetical protein
VDKGNPTAGAFGQFSQTSWNQERLALLGAGNVGSDAGVFGQISVTRCILAKFFVTAKGINLARKSTKTRFSIRSFFDASMGGFNMGIELAGWLQGCESAGCVHCPREFSCGILQSSLTIVESEVARCGGEVAWQAVKDVKDELAAQGFDYPYARRQCQLREQECIVRSLTERLIDVYQGIWRHPRSEE